MKTPALNEALWDALHILSASAGRPVSRAERMELQNLAEISFSVGSRLVHERGRVLSDPEVHILLRLAAAGLRGAVPLADTPPQGTRKRE